MMSVPSVIFKRWSVFPDIWDKPAPMWPCHTLKRNGFNKKDEINVPMALSVFRDGENGFKIPGPAIYSQADPLTLGKKPHTNPTRISHRKWRKQDPWKDEREPEEQKYESREQNHPLLSPPLPACLHTRHWLQPGNSALPDCTVKLQFLISLPNRVATSKSIAGNQIGWTMNY